MGLRFGSALHVEDRAAQPFGGYKKWPALAAKRGILPSSFAVTSQGSSAWRHPPSQNMQLGKATRMSVAEVPRAVFAPLKRGIKTFDLRSSRCDPGCLRQQVRDAI